MNTLSKLTVILALVSGAAYGQESPNIVASDACEDTAMGSYALGTLTGCTGQAIYDTAAGALAMYNTASGGFNNTAFGGAALYANLTGNSNTAVGASALNKNLASGNSAVGVFALTENQNGTNLTAVGANALRGAYLAATGSNNTAIGASALTAYSSGANNTASGFAAMYSNTTGSGNTGTGADALYSTTDGSNNTAFGYQALFSNTIGKGNAAQGVNALYNNTTGIRNLGIGSNALYANVSGSYNIALGFDAGYNVTTGSNNIEIGASGTASDNGTIQIGVQGTQTSTMIAGVFGTQLTGSAVYVTSSGQLGVLASSERYKTDISPIGTNTEKLKQLRPVSFHLKTDPHGAVQYGLIAEEVAKVYPELVIRDGKGKIEGVHYEELTPMLLNEMQEQQRINLAQAAEIHDLKQQVAKLNDLEQRLNAVLQHLESNGAVIAQR